MKKIILILITCLLLVTSNAINLCASSSTDYTPEDFKIDTVYHFKAGDSISFNGKDFTFTKVSETSRDSIDTKKYVFEEDFDATIFNYCTNEEDLYLTINQAYDVVYDLMGKGESMHTPSKLYWYSAGYGQQYASLPMVPTCSGYMFDGWYEDVDYINPITWDSDGEYRVYGDTTIYAKWAEVHLKCISAKDASIDDEEIIEIIPIADNQREYDVTLLPSAERPVMGVDLLNNEGAYIRTLITNITYNEEKQGYFYTYVPEENETILHFYVVNNDAINTNYVINCGNVNEEEVLINKGWPWGSDFIVNDDDYSLVLNIDTIEDKDNITYQWQSSLDNAIFSDIEGQTNKVVEIHNTDGNTYQSKWYRCLIKYEEDSIDKTCISKSVEVLDSRIISKDNNELYGNLFFESTNRNIDGTKKGLYVSNGYEAYCLDSDNKQYFNVIGKYNNGLKDYWLSCSCDSAWALYMKNNDNEFVGSDNIDTIICSFDDKNVEFDIKLKNKADIALYTDTCIGRFPEIYYADGAAIKANLEDGQLVSTYLVANKDFHSANLNDAAGFVFEPITAVDTFTIDAFINGPYNNTSKGQYEYIVNDYDNEKGLSYEEIFEILKDNIFNYCDGVNYDTYGYGNDPFVYRDINNQKVVAAIYSKDSILAYSWKQVDNIKYKMAISNAINIGIDNIDLENIIKERKHSKSFVFPKTNVD